MSDALSDEDLAKVDAGHARRARAWDSLRAGRHRIAWEDILASGDAFLELAREADAANVRFWSAEEHLDNLPADASDADLASAEEDVERAESSMLAAEKNAEDVILVLALLWRGLFGTAVWEEPGGRQIYLMYFEHDTDDGFLTPQDEDEESVRHGAELIQEKTQRQIPVCEALAVLNLPHERSAPGS
ncbi:MAG TPA: hypothetical protein VEA41_16390 [Salinarimonas sp.]|nr:hypothetical protein [Salinarimonas sp.]